jgi:hypothetical protein
MSKKDHKESPLEKVKEKVHSVLAKYPAIDEPLSKMATNIKIDKAFIVIAAVLALPLVIYSLYSGGSLIM